MWTVNVLIKRLQELIGEDMDNGDLPIVIGLIGGTLLDDVEIEHLDGDPKLPYVRICSIKDDRISLANFGINRSLLERDLPES